VTARRQRSVLSVGSALKTRIVAAWGGAGRGADASDQSRSIGLCHRKRAGSPWCSRIHMVCIGLHGGCAPSGMLTSRTCSLLPGGRGGRASPARRSTVWWRSRGTLRSTGHSATAHRAAIQAAAVRALSHARNEAVKMALDKNLDIAVRPDLRYAFGVASVKAAYLRPSARHWRRAQTATRTGRGL